MNTLQQKITTYLIVLIWLVNANFALATPAQIPLYIGVSAAKPNLMLMIDTSGSMGDSVSSSSTINSPNEMPSGFNFTCSSSYALSGGVTPPSTPTTTIYMKITSTGAVKICTNADCSKMASFGSKKKGKCFTNTQNYTVADYGGSTLSGGPYTGLKLNWYFSKGTFTSSVGISSAKQTSTSTRLAIAKQAANDLIDSLTPSSGNPATVRMGLSTYNYNSGTGDGGTLLSEIKDLDSTQATNLHSQISDMSKNGNTPLATTLSDIGKYFALGETADLKLHPGTSSPTSKSIDQIFSKSDDTTAHSIKNSTGTTTLIPPILGYCQKSFVILVSDGLPNGDREISSFLRDYTGDCATKGLCDSTVTTTSLPGASTLISLTANGTACNSTGNWGNMYCKNGTKAGRIYETKGSDYLDDVAQALYEMDLRPSLDSSQKAVTHNKNNVVTYAIGLADTGLQSQSVLSDAAKVGGGKFYFAADANALASALDDAIDDISSRVGSSSSVAANSSKLESGSVIYQAKFDSADWTGIFTAFPLSASEDTNGNGVLDTGEDSNSNGILDAGYVGTKIWNAAENMPTYASRNIVTYNASTKLGATFNCDGLSSSQKSILGISDCTSNSDQGVWRLNYLRGDPSHEQINSNRKDTDHIRTGTNLIFRNRTHLDKVTSTAVTPDPWILGDIVNSDPIFVSAEDYGYSKLSNTTEASLYSSFVIQNKERKKMLYVGANDGMLHGFDASTSSGDTGAEIFAYVPNAVYNQLRSLTDPNYNHVYSVDGSPRVGDVFFDSSWHTVLLNTTGAGGKAIFALDITNPTSFNNGKVLWEISDSYSPTAADTTTDWQATDTTSFRGFGNNLGYTLPQPSIVKMQDGSWVAIVANGYNSINNLAVLYIINIQTGQLIKAFDTKAGGASSPNGLSTPIAVDTNGDKMADAIYAGDLLGNMWKFDVSSDNKANWSIAYGTSTTPAPLFIACTDSSNCSTTRQPITAKPQVGRSGASQSSSGVMVYFGTGKYFEDVDTDVSNPQTQTFYGIWDNNTTVNRSNLQSQSILLKTASNGKNLRVTTDNSVDYTSKKGWYLDLLPPSSTTSVGERVISAPLLRNGKVIFLTLIPIPPVTTEICGAGSSGSSFLVELEALSGSRPSATAARVTWDINGDGMVNADDLTTVVINGESTKVSASGIESTIGSMKLSERITNGNLAYSYSTETYDGEDSNGKPNKAPTENNNSPTTVGSRQSWKQILQ